MTAEQREIEADDKMTRAGRLATKHKITIQEAMVELGSPGTVSFNRQEKQEDMTTTDAAKPAPKGKP